MRRILVAAVLVAGLAGCGASGTSDSASTTVPGAEAAAETTTTTEAATTTTERTTTTAAPTTTTTLPPNPKVGEVITFDTGAKITIHAYEQPVPPGQFNTPDPGNELAAVDVEVCAGTMEASYNQLAVGARDTSNRVYGVSAAEVGVREPGLSSGNLPPGQCRRGWAAFQVPSGPRPVAVVWDYPGWELASWEIPAA